MTSEYRGLLQKPEEVEPASFISDNSRPTAGAGKEQGSMVTTKGAGLNPNAKVWQEVSAPPTHNPEEGMESPDWPQADHTPTDQPEGCKGYNIGFVDSESGPPVDGGLLNGIDSDISYPVYEPVEGEVVEEMQPLSEETLRESLKKQLEFCFSRENLSKDLYLMSQMDSDQFVPIWTIASMEGIKLLTTDMDLILEVLRASPMVQVDEKGEKVRPNHKRCIIILREVPETTPVEEVESLFKNEKCPQAISVEFAHNNNWYITFQSDTDAQQAYKYLREEVKTFQGKPIMARIKAINTFFAKNGYGAVDSAVYTSSPQSQYSSPVYVQQMYQQPPQQYPLYSLLPQAWTPSPTPYFETPLAPFPNSTFVNGFSAAGSYKNGSSPLSLTRHFPRNRLPLYSRKNVINTFRNHVKPQPRTDGTPQSEALLGTGTPQTPRTPTTVASSDASTLSLCDTPPSPIENTHTDLGSSRARRGSYRGMRRRREDERTRPLPLTEVKSPPPKFDLAATNFPPLPGGVAGRLPGGMIPPTESGLENRMADVVKGINRDKSDATKQDVHKESQPSQSDGPAPLTTTSAPKPDTPGSSIAHQVKRPDSDSHVSTAHSPAPVTTTPVPEPAPVPVPAPVQPALVPKPAPSSPSPPSSTPVPEPRKLSYAEVCQKPPKDPPPAPVPSPSPTPSPTASQPLRELRVNKAEAPVPTESSSSERVEKGVESRAPREQNSYHRGGGYRGAGFKLREQQRRPPQGRRPSPQVGYNRRSGKEQNIPPRSPK
ncbi:la-related protein 4-like isoform X1 [Astyanax mexicanus]|uniref:La ribonucleoprotein 4 n=1 Tax=Astyanax mexicanus TaxID=7994 RepID=A0A8B9L647_ASTMX|nr:la-related protein 4-like isoform X1 [Astyanax mexicanus]